MMNNQEKTIKSPSLPPLYFHETNKTTTAVAADVETEPVLNLPSELMQECLVAYCNWGDLAKLSTVQSSWKSLVRDAANYGGRTSKWELAEALLKGTHGMERNPALAIQYLTEMSGVVTVDSSSENDKQPRLVLASHDDADAAVEPYAPAMRKIATCLLKGGDDENSGVVADSVVGVCWLKAAFELGGDVDAAHELAVVHEYGEHGTEIDVVLAADYFHKAAIGGHVEAMAEYGMCCELGCGREQSDEEAIEWYIKAANQGHVTAHFSVGEAFEEARGVPQSDEEACLWYYKAAAMGDEDSRKALKRLQDIARIVVPGVGNLLYV